MGFCLFNNVAVAARHAIDACGAERVLMLDWDVHHGNGTEAIFADAPDVLFVSIHESPLYPGTGPADYRGRAEGEGLTSTSRSPAGRAQSSSWPWSSRSWSRSPAPGPPSLIAISAGYDAHRDDPLASCRVETEAYAR